jgi:hypothetical protein
VATGGGLPTEHQAFFQAGLKYRAPGFVATSFSRDVAYGFSQRACSERGHPAVLWVVHMHPEGARNPRYACKHVNLVRKTHVAGEAEYLFAPYSVFTVQRVEWSVLGAANATADQPHIVHLEAAVDNQQEPEDLPLAPWH